MAFFGLFKKKDEFDSLLKDPLTDPLGSMPQEFNAPSMPGMQNNNQMPNFETPGTNFRDETALGDFSMAPNQNEFGTNAASVQTNNSSYSSSPPMFRGSPQIMPKGRGSPEVFEEMPAKPSISKQDLPSFDRRDFEILNSKLDNIKSELENLNHRLDNLERGNNDSQTQRRRYAW